MKNLLPLCCLLFALWSCNKDDNETAPWPEEYESIFSYTITDSEGDLILANSEAPNHLYQFAPMDVKSIQIGLNGEYLYIRADYADTIPFEQVTVEESDTTELQHVRNQSISVVIDADNSDATGAAGDSVKGVDLFFAINFIYGSYSMQYANFDFPDGNIHNNTGTTKGELGAGGPGTTFAIVRYKLSDISTYISAGKSVEIGGWAESESYKPDGSKSYHHFAFDAFSPGTWTIE